MAAMNTAAESPRRLSTLAKWGVWIALAALLLPMLGLVAVVIAAALLIRGEIGPGLGILLLAPICAMFGYGLAVGLGVV